MEEEKLYNILKIITEEICETEFEWRLDGSANLLVQGVSDAKPRDVDIRTWERGIKIFREKFGEFIKQDFLNEKKAYSLILDILGEEIEINHYLDGKFDKDIKLKKVEWKGLALNCLSLKDAERFYRNIGRIESADRLKNFLSSDK